MGATSRYDPERGVCVSTGKLAPAGEEHEPKWSRWHHDYGPYWTRWCEATDWCETQDYKTTTEARP